MTHVLILGGTTEASALATALAERGVPATLSYAGRVASPKPQPVAVRVGGFGGVAGLVEWLDAERVTHLVDATHPFAAQMSANAVSAAAKAGVPHIALSRPGWVEEDGDRWSRVADISSAVAALAGPLRNVMLALGRMHVAAFAAQPQHRYLLRFVDPPSEPVALRDYRLVVDRGPFTVAGDVALLRENAIDLIVCKDAGGTGAQAKLIAARSLGVPVVMIDRPWLPERTEVHDVAAVLAWIGHAADRGV
ncbi:cobalt-precorrin-6A reductase [Sphingomonas glacialis]|uniref:Cobalt-precorrin-6A reductase n=1 Tax=Sphingomonas glacialis TaxID=658225 RepID=A0A502FZA6_9SPHN|nr:cobalt-precorrin-6A reductase [Sphingomonas glacialis]TPG54213.1 cobalt-precorrin-6A reductase [Sphingomonas glacialis]